MTHRRFVCDQCGQPWSPERPIYGLPYAEDGHDTADGETDHDLDADHLAYGDTPVPAATSTPEES